MEHYSYGLIDDYGKNGVNEFKYIKGKVEEAQVRGFELC
jgi:hypothetical protein